MRTSTPAARPSPSGSAARLCFFRTELRTDVKPIRRDAVGRSQGAPQRRGDHEAVLGPRGRGRREARRVEALVERPGIDIQDRHRGQLEESRVPSDLQHMGTPDLQPFQRVLIRARLDEGLGDPAARRQERWKGQFLERDGPARGGWWPLRLGWRHDDQHATLTLRECRGGPRDLTRHAGLARDERHATPLTDGPAGSRLELGPLAALSRRTTPSSDHGGQP